MKAGATSCSEEGVPLPSLSSTAQSTDLFQLQAQPPSCRGTAQSLIWGCLLMLAVAQRWFLWQLQRQMHGWLQLRYHQPRYPRIFLPKGRQMAMWYVGTDPAVTAPDRQWRRWAKTLKTSCECSSLCRFQLSPCHNTHGRWHSLTQQRAGCCHVLPAFVLPSPQPCYPSEDHARCLLRKVRHHT